MDALNLYLKDIYGEKQIIKDGIVPEDFNLRVPSGASYPMIARFLEDQKAFLLLAAEVIL